MEIGMIGMWSGSVASIPTNYALCDGSNGTPDLRDKFVVGAGSAYTPGDSGGSDSQVHTFTGDGHYHELTQPGDIPNDAAAYDPGSSTEQVTGTTDSSDNRPPYYSLAYIMRIA